jgi:hypothetical protein
MSAVAIMFSPGGVATAPPASDYECARGGAAVTGTVTYNTNGTVSVDPGLGTSGTNTTHNWFTPTTPNIGNLYFLKITPTAGALTSNAASTFTALSSNLAITRQSNAGGPLQQCTYTVEISTNSGGTNIVSTQIGNIIGADGT